jgi:choline dehydrogenase-like flavoprotein
MPDFDVVIVGAGAGGGVVAWALARAGWRVALLEKGRNAYPTLAAPVLQQSTWGNDEVRFRRNYGFHDPFIEPRTWLDTHDGSVKTGSYQPLGVTVGGGTVHYDGDSPRLQRVDFRMGSTYGAVEGADVVDWPIGYDDLAPYYDAAERLVGIQGLAGADPFAEPRGPYPMPPGYPSKSGLLLSRAARALGYHPHPMPMAINSITYEGRPACVNCGFCAFGCPVDAKGSSAVSAVRGGLLSGNLTLMAECCALSVETEPSGTHASGVVYLDARGERRTVTARHIVLALNAIETPRLLFASARASHPDGLGNRSGLVGRNLMFHIIFAVIGFFDFEIRSYRGRPLTHALADFTRPDGSPDWLRGGYVELGGTLHPIEEGLHYPWRFHRELMLPGGNRRRIAAASMIGEDVPQRDNRVELDPSVRDVYGRPVARITYRRHPHDQRLLDYYMPKLEAIVRGAGAGSSLRRDPATDDGVPDTKHLLGTTRMGADPTRSVTDPWGRLHDVDNVWIADGGLWPTSSAFNPTITQQALALRTAAYMIDPMNPRP